jgi:hypothetical protein
MEMPCDSVEALDETMAVAVTAAALAADAVEEEEEEDDAVDAEAEEGRIGPAFCFFSSF